ncbi:unnamed protein product [Dovyalis caffra]|uniref:Uncharacterized protein n=1 Tax=Dovyalis caffra TaxID=77055 RepID=A0AAV1RWI1_9ROSI|nr:unnamed protein product [Dovyalis caffra]
MDAVEHLRSVILLSQETKFLQSEMLQRKKSKPTSCSFTSRKAHLQQHLPPWEQLP